MKKTALLLTLIIAFSCETNEIRIDSENVLLGFWDNPIYKGETTTFKRANELPNEAYGISFSENGTFVEKTSGWCGTPPLTFFNIEGAFELKNNLISIKTENYPTNYVWRIVSLTKNELVVKRELTAQEIAHRNLMDLFNEIQNLSNSFSCEDSKDWTFVAYGAKACGGPQGYIAYSTKIDTVTFLEKVANYTKAEKDFNIKYGIDSDCSLADEPATVICKNGFPRFTYLFNNL
ncbi:hypothetical protein [uncultured Polaribacter sp.]|uniref:hypothetical protein n=1 Tax=uncultured Polaribacter sp. TaxID=174711 RepID=UPI0026352D3F|nr:hypothetical protein [uncultured Polaribacter sp.]